MDDVNTNRDEALRNEISGRSRDLFGDAWVDTHENDIETLVSAVQRVEEFPIDAFTMLNSESSPDE